MAGQRHSAAHDPIFSVSTTDARADRGRREISVSPERVTIRRRLQGIDMRLSLAVSAYRGVALCLEPGPRDILTYQLRLVHADSDLCVVLDEAPHDLDIIADWRLWAKVLGLPALVEREIGVYEAADASPDAVSTSGTLARRKRPLKRRPRFLSRRIAGDASRPAMLHSDEREIIARD